MNVSDKFFSGKIDGYMLKLDGTDKYLMPDMYRLQAPDLKTTKCEKCSGAFQENEIIQFWSTWSYGVPNRLQFYHDKCWRELTDGESQLSKAS